MMNRYRNIPGLRGPTKATPGTLCQKCLKRDIFECKVSAQERPYISRPSRTQQLQNPALVPNLTTDVPNELLRTKGVADELLAKKDQERGRQRNLDGCDRSFASNSQTLKRTGSLSSDSSSSVSTISTNLSRTRSPHPRRRYDTEDSRERYSRRITSSSPSISRQRKRRYSERSSSYSCSPASSVERRRSRTREPDLERNTRRRRRESSPHERGRRHDSTKRGSWRDRSQSRSRERIRIARGRRSMTPSTIGESSHPVTSTRDSYRRDGAAESKSDWRSQYRRHERTRRDRQQPALLHRERSLSPFSKRLALTQAMNMGR